MKNAPVPANENERLSALRKYLILDTFQDKEFDKLTELAAIICKAPISSLSLIEENKQLIKSGRGIDFKQTDRKDSFCQYTIMESSILEVQDTTQDERFKENVLVTGNPFIRFYAGYPLIDPDGYRIGTICVLDHKTRKLDEEQKRALKLLAEQAMSLIVDQQKREELINLERLFKLSTDLICVAGKDGYFKKVNPAFEKLLGWDEESLLKKSFVDLIHPKDLEKSYSQISKVFSGETTATFEQRFRSKTGQYYYLQWVTVHEPLTGQIFAIGRDISEDKIQADNLRFNEEKFRSFFENSQGLMFTHDMSGKFLTINSAGAELLGYQVSEVLEMNFSDLMPVEHRQSFRRYLRDIKANGKSNGLTTTVDSKGNHKIWNYQNILVKNQAGFDYVVGNGTDVTHSQQLAKNLFRMQEMLLQTNELARVGGWEMDFMHKKTYWSDVTKQIFQVQPGFEPDMQSALGRYTEESQKKITVAMQEAISIGRNFDLELELITDEGTGLWVRVIGNVVFEAGKCSRLYGAFQDIDHMKKAEQELIGERARLLAFVKHAPAAVAMFDNDIRYMAISNRWLEDYQLTGQDIIGKSHYEVFPDVSGKWEDVHQRSLAGAIVKEQEEMWRPDGWDHDLCLNYEVRPWFQFDGTIGGIMMFTQDITETALRRDELKHAIIQAQQANLAKSEFLANMSHEIRTPLNGVIGFTDLVLETSLNDTQRQYLVIVNQSAQALLSIITDILDFTKIEAGKFELDINKSDIYDIAEQSVDIISFPVQNKGLEMLLNIPAELPRFLWVDAIRLKQVLINLLGNSAKFTKVGEIELKIEILHYDPELSNEIICRFIVRDTGIGIRKDKQLMVFEAFMQEDSSTTKKYGGTGLGLTISNKLLEMMGSHLQLKSVYGTGSSFFFDLKLLSETGIPVVWDNTGQIKRVLIVDDNQNNRTILEKILQRLHIVSDMAESGFECLRMLSEGKKYDAIFMDYHMPLMDGIETVSRIRKGFPQSFDQLQIILLSSSADDQKLIENCELLKVNYRLMKPIKIADISLCFLRLSQQTEAARSNPQTEKIHNLDGLTILIAEDNLINMLFTKTIIRKIAPNAIVIEAVNGEEAVELCKKQLPDIIFMDIQMPEMNGLEATLLIREMDRKHHVQIIALTAGNLMGDREKCFEVGMDDFVSKPFIKEDIWQVMTRTAVKSSMLEA